MARTRERVIPRDRETPDRRAFERWMGKRTLGTIAPLLGTSKQRLSEWLRHEAEVSDLDVDRWVRVTKIARSTFFEGRYRSVKLRARLAGNGKKAA